MTNDPQFWRGMFTLLAISTLLVLLIPALADWVGTWLHAHAIAMTRWYRALATAFREYRRTHKEVMAAEQSAL